MPDRLIEDALVAITNQARSALSAANIGNFVLKLTIEGRVDGSAGVVIQFDLSEYGYTPSTKGRELDAVIEEFLRRNGFDKEQGRKLLSFADSNPNTQLARELDDEIPF